MPIVVNGDYIGHQFLKGPGHCLDLVCELLLQTEVEARPKHHLLGLVVETSHNCKPLEVRPMSGGPLITLGEGG